MKFEPWTQEPVGPDVGYMIRSSHKSGRSLMTGNDFVWPESGYVEAKDTTNLLAYVFSTPVSGLYGLLDGVGDWNLLPRGKDVIVQVVAVLRSECQPDPYGNSVYAPRGWVLYSGDALGALQFAIPKIGRNRGIGQLFCDDIVDVVGNQSALKSVDLEEQSQDASTTGDYLSNVSTSGNRRYAVATRGGMAIASGHAGCAFVGAAGYAHAPNTYGVAVSHGSPRGINYSDLQSADIEGSGARAGIDGLAVSLGPDGKARAGRGGAIFLVEWERPLSTGFLPRVRLVFSSKVGENGIKADTWYRLKDGKPVEVRS